MPRIRSRQFENFGDGLLTICDADERKITRTKMEHIRFGNRTVGVQRFWQAKTAGNKVDRLVSVPLSVAGLDLVSTNDVVIIETEKVENSSHQYAIKQVQPKYDAEPPALYLSLEKLVHPFKDGRDSGGG
ncbi:MAG: hypothetical protein ACOYBA_02520 [Coprococcus sp.]|jgi:hypothetical protein